MAVPEHVVVREIAPLGDLRRLRLQLLQAHHVGLVALSHSQSCASRARMPLTFQVAIFIDLILGISCAFVNASALVPAIGGIARGAPARCREVDHARALRAAPNRARSIASARPRPAYRRDGGGERPNPDRRDIVGAVGCASASASIPSPAKIAVRSW